MPAPSELQITSSTGDYVVRIGAGLFAQLLADHDGDQVIADAFFADGFAQDLPAERVQLIEAVESNKTLGGAETLIAGLRDRGTRRGEELLAVGGGIVQDVATLTASLYMRGLRWSYAPTTLLGMADSCIGGKSSINVGPYKNLAGNFHPPAVVVVDPAFIATLTAEDRAGGLCEAMKISFCRGPEAFARYLELYDNFDSGDDAAAALLAHVLASKKWFIEIDEFDRAERRQLNFGHTFAHALEAATSFGVSHGIAVGIGVLAAERLAVAVDGEAAAQPQLAEHALGLVRQAPDLGARLGSLDHERFEAAFLSDKKHGADGLHVILPQLGGGTAERVLPGGSESLTLVRGALETVLPKVVA
jgi:3-dehydroquinate synthase